MTQITYELFCQNHCIRLRRPNCVFCPKVGTILKKSVDWSNTDTILPRESINKATVSLQIPEVLNNKAIKVLLCKILNQQRYCTVSNPRIFKGEAIQVLLHQKLWIVKAIVSFQTPEFYKMKRYKYLYAKHLNLLEAIVLLQTPESFSDEAIQLLILLLLFEAIVWVPYFWGWDERIHRFNIALKRQ